MSVNPYLTPTTPSRFIGPIMRSGARYAVNRLRQQLNNWRSNRQAKQNLGRNMNHPLGRWTRSVVGGRSRRHRRVRKFRKKLTLKTPHVKGRVKRGRRKRRVRVTKRLRKAIKKTAWENLPKGFLKIVSCDAFALTAATNKQNWGQILESRPTGGANGWLFCPSAFLDAASILFNGYISSTAWAANNQPIDGTNGNVYTGYMDPESTELYVKKSWARVCWKNFGPRTLKLRVYVAKPKFKDSFPTSTNSVPGPLDATKVNTPIGMWNQILTREAQGANFKSGPKNVLGNGIDTLYMDPRTNTSLAKYYAFDCIQIDLAPGQCYDHIVKGPEDFLFKGASYLDGQPGVAGYQFKEIQKFARNVFFTCNYDLLGASDAGGALAAGFYSSGNTGEFLACETRQYFDIRCPNNAGFLSTTAGFNGTTQLTQRHEAYCNLIIQTRAITPQFYYETINGGVTVTRSGTQP